MTKTGFKPDIYNDFLSMPSFKNEEDAKKKGIDPDDNALSHLAETQGWKILEKHIESLGRESDQFVIDAVAKGYPRDEVGTYAIVAALLKNALSQIINKVHDAREAAAGTE